MNRFVLFALCAVAFGMAFGNDVVPKGWQGYVKARRVCVSRDTETLPGYVITKWQRDGKPDWILPAVETNAVKKIKGKVQNNPLQGDAEKTKKIRAAKKNAAKKDAKNLEKAIKDLVKARDKSSEAMRDMYQSVIDILTESDELNGGK